MDFVATNPSAVPRRRLDWSAPFSVAMVLLLALLVLMPMFWLSLTSLRNDAKQFTLEHYRQLFIDPSLLTPLLTTLWTSGRGRRRMRAHRGAHELAGGAHRPAGQAPAAHVDTGLVRYAAVFGRVCVGASRWVPMRVSSTSGITRLFGLKPFEAQPLINIFFRRRHGVRDGFVHLSLCLHVHCQQP